VTPGEIHERMAADAENVCRTLLPSGKRVGAEWKCGSVTGEPGDSLGVRLTGNKAGIWNDFASSGGGGDMIDLVKACRNCSLRDALQWCRQYLGIRDERYEVEPKRKAAKPIAAPATTANTPEVIKWFENRGISSATLDKYRVVSRGNTVAFPCWVGNEVFHIKYRDTAKPKNQAFFTSKDSTPVLFGWQAIDEDAREVVIAEGECDALAYAEQGYPALSVPMGASLGGNGWNGLTRFTYLPIWTMPAEHWPSI